LDLNDYPVLPNWESMPEKNILRESLNKEDGNYKELNRRLLQFLISDNL